MFATFTIDPLPAWIAAALVATLFAHAALAKLADQALLTQHLAAYGVPYRALEPLSRALPATELLAAVLILTPLRAIGASIAAALLLVYAAAMAWHLVRGHRLDCGCGSEALPVSWLLVSRNVLLAALATTVALPTTGRSMTLVDFALVAASLLLGVVLYAAFNQVLRHAGRSQAHPALERV